MELFNSNRDAMLKLFHLDDPTTAEGLKAYQQRVYEKVRDDPEPIKVQDQIVASFG